MPTKLSHKSSIIKTTAAIKKLPKKRSLASKKASAKEHAHFRRYTTLSALIHMLQTKTITLLNPATWDDKNDAYFMSEYKRKLCAQSVLAICFAKCTETYHHWRVFSNGPDGVCIEFEKDRILAAFQGTADVKMGDVQYKLIDALKKKSIIDVEELPFLKRKPYEDEKECRVIHIDYSESKEAESFPIEISSIKRITLSPWMARPLRDSVAKTLQSITDCDKLKISRSTLIGNNEWQALTSLAK